MAANRCAVEIANGLSVFNQAGNVIEPHEDEGEFKEP
jgi:hypothetical protein